MMKPKMSCCSSHIVSVATCNCRAALLTRRCRRNCIDCLKRFVLRPRQIVDNLCRQKSQSWWRCCWSLLLTLNHLQWRWVSITGALVLNCLQPVGKIARGHYWWPGMVQPIRTATCSCMVIWPAHRFCLPDFCFISLGSLTVLRLLCVC